MSAAPEIGAGSLRQALDAARHANKVSMSDLTVLSSGRDPFRLDTPANHRDAAWLAERVADLLPADRTIHLRGLHYTLLGCPKPDGRVYVNDDGTWTWLSEKAAKAARWLGYLPFGRIVDQRNAAPVVRLAGLLDPTPLLDLGELRVELPEEVTDPTVHLVDHCPPQPFSLALYGEKASLEPVLGPLADEYDASLFLPTGEISDTLMYTMAQAAYLDGRPLVVFTFSDCDPAGWQMPVSIARKLQALAVAVFPGLAFEVRRVGLLPENVREYGLPSTPLKASESRADRWRAAMGVDQTEIDALASLRPELLRELAVAALDGFHDPLLQHRADVAAVRWQTSAQEVLHDRIGPERLADYRRQAQDKLDAIREQVAELSTGLRVDASDLDLPDYTPPTPQVSPPDDAPLVSSSWSFTEQCQALKASKMYGGEAE